MQNLEPSRPIGWSRWSLSLALFALLLAGVVVGLHRITLISTPTALSAIVAAFLCAGLAILSGLVAMVVLWRKGGLGTSRALFGILLAAGLFGWPLVYLPALMNKPVIHDISTDTSQPPPFIALAQQREPEANSAQYGGPEVARLQAAAYPDIRPFFISRSLEEAYDIAMDAVRRLKMDVVTDEPPSSKTRGLGYIEAVDRTPIIGFYDDVVLRISSEGPRARIDVRSASRYGRSDLGRNAQRVRIVLRELKARFEASVPSTDGGYRRWQARLPGTISKSVIGSRAKGARANAAVVQSGRDPAPQDGERAPRRKGQPRQ